ncbi:hypothetical protein [Streptomyces sp. CoH27]|uniref:hypothetical protein n=1 Tax=Streptomyces sp. CoH27 TaxID=2875763 RepID=UPI001CD78D44|nr:hypothetical protein [Streptomyces sp. CoH27]
MAAVVLGGLPAAARQAAAAGVSCSTNVYKRTFYKNTAFSGSPVRTDPPAPRVSTSPSRAVSTPSASTT